MEIEIVKEIETPLLSRKRVTAWASFKGATPSRVQILKEAAKVLKVKEDLVSIRHIYTRFGYEKVKLIIHVYDDADTMAKLEGKGLVDKHKSKAEEKKEEKPAPEKKEAEAEEKPAEEETKEEEKPEEKKEEPAEEDNKDEKSKDPAEEKK